MSTIVCRHCGKALHQHAEKALSGEVQMVWADAEDNWVCEKTGEEHITVYRADPEPTAPGTFIVVEGDPVSGFVFHGIPAFDTPEAAGAWAEDNCTVQWWIAPLQDVE